LPRYVHARQGAAWDCGNQFAGQPDGVIADSSTIYCNQYAIDGLDVEVVANQQHGPGGQLKHVLTGTVGKDGLQPAEAPGTHHNQISIDFFGDPQHSLFGVSFSHDGSHFGGDQSHATDGVVQENVGLIAVVLEILASLFVDHMQKVDPCLATGGDGPQHAYHFFNVAFA